MSQLSELNRRYNLQCPIPLCGCHRRIVQKQKEEEKPKDKSVLGKNSCSVGGLRSKSSTCCKCDGGQRRVKFSCDTSDYKNEKPWSNSHVHQCDSYCQPEYHSHLSESKTRPNSANLSKHGTCGRTLEHICALNLSDSEGNRKSAGTCHVPLEEKTNGLYERPLNVSAERLERHRQTKQRLGMTECYDDCSINNKHSHRCSEISSIRSGFLKKHPRMYHVCQLTSGKDVVDFNRKSYLDCEVCCQSLSNKSILSEPTKKADEKFPRARHTTTIENCGGMKPAPKFQSKTSFDDKYKIERMPAGRNDRFKLCDYHQEKYGGCYSKSGYKTNSKYHHCDTLAMENRSSSDNRYESLYDINTTIPDYLENMKDREKCCNCYWKQKCHYHSNENIKTRDEEATTKNFLVENGEKEPLELLDIKYPDSKLLKHEKMAAKPRDHYSSFTSKFDERLENDCTERMAAGGDNNLTGKVACEEPEASLPEDIKMLTRSEVTGTEAEMGRWELSKQLDLLRRIQELLFQLLQGLRQEARRYTCYEQKCQQCLLKETRMQQPVKTISKYPPTGDLAFNEQFFQPITESVDDEQSGDDESVAAQDDTTTFSLLEELEAAHKNAQELNNIEGKTSKINEELRRIAENTTKVYCMKDYRDSKFNEKAEELQLSGRENPFTKCSDVNETKLLVSDSQEEILKRFIDDCFMFSQHFAVYSKRYMSMDAAYIAESLNRCASLMGKTLKSVISNDDFWRTDTPSSPLQPFKFEYEQTNNYESQSSPEISGPYSLRKKRTCQRPPGKKVAVKGEIAKKTSCWKAGIGSKYVSTNSNRTIYPVKRLVPCNSSFKRVENSMDYQGKFRDTQKDVELHRSLPISNDPETKLGSKSTSSGYKENITKYTSRNNALKLSRTRRQRVWHKWRSTIED